MMKRITLALVLLAASAVGTSAQLEIKSNGKVIAGPDRSGDDQDGVLSMSVFGKIGENRAGSKLAFGDFGKQENVGWNVFLGEWGNEDSDILWLHGKYGMRMTSWDGTFLLGEWDIFNGNGGFMIYDNVRADRMAVSSADDRKSNVVNIPYALYRIMQLNGKTYSYSKLENTIGGSNSGQTRMETGSDITEKEQVDMMRMEQARALRTIVSTRYGLLASELSQQFPELVESDIDGNEFINYMELVPVLISAINELYEAIEDAGVELNVQAPANNAKGAKVGIYHEKQALVTDEARLYQNSPNPFSAETVIEYQVPTNAKSAYMYVFNLNGEMLQSYALTQYGHGSVIVSGGTLAAGMYVYSLVVDEQIVDTKQMILTK